MKQTLLTAGVALLVACTGSAQTSSAGGNASTQASGATSGSSTSGQPTSGSTGAGAACPACAPPTEVGKLASDQWEEISGLVASKDHPGTFFLHNDSGDAARFFAMDATGADQGTFNVTNATAVDWEDIARGPCAAVNESCLYLADMGDNRAKRSDYKLYRVKEPAALGAGPHDVTAETIPFSYPDGMHNAECLLIHPSTGEIVIVTKSAGGSSAYRFPTPLVAGTAVTLEKVGDVPMPDLVQLVTGGDVRPDGSLAVVRTYGYAYGYPIGQGETLGEALTKEPCKLPAASEDQGEALGWLLDGTGYLTVSEGDESPIHRVTCQ